MPVVLKNIDELTSKAVAHYWRTLDEQAEKQRSGSAADRGGRAAVTGGKQMDGFCDLVNHLLIDNGLPSAAIYTSQKLELPGYFRGTKRWDMVVVSGSVLVAAIEFKSQRGPSFGNNFNNRAEEAIGTGKDMAVAFREGAFGHSPAPWLGWVMLLEDCPASRAPVGNKEPHFDAFPEFHDASYAQRYELLLRRLVREKLYSGAAFLVATEGEGRAGRFREPASDLKMRPFLAQLAGHVGALAAGR